MKKCQWGKRELFLLWLLWPSRFFNVGRSVFLGSTDSGLSRAIRVITSSPLGHQVSQVGAFSRVFSSFLSFTSPSRSLFSSPRLSVIPDPCDWLFIPIVIWSGHNDQLPKNGDLATDNCSEISSRSHYCFRAIIRRCRLGREAASASGSARWIRGASLDKKNGGSAIKSNKRAASFISFQQKAKVTR